MNINVRVYGLVLENGQLLVLEENYLGRKLIKFPGGGLEPREGLADCLRREFREEMDATIASMRHFYTQDFYVESAFSNIDQIITVYYLVQLTSALTTLTFAPEILHHRLIDFKTEKNPMTLPVDTHVYDLLSAADPASLSW